MRRGGVDVSVACGEWQPEQDSAPGGHYARSESEGNLHVGIPRK